MEDVAERQLGKLSALHLFRRDYVAGKKEIDKRTNWVSAEAWNEVRDAFHALPPERKESYEKQRLNHVDREKSLRGVKKQSDQPILLLSSRSSRTQQVAERKSMLMHSGHEPLVAGINDAAPILANLLPADFDEMCAATENVEDMSKVTRGYATEQNKSTDTVWPVGEANVLAAMTVASAKGYTLKQAQKDFTQKCQVVCGPEPGLDTFPTKVMIHGQCGALCQLEHSVHLRLLHQRISDALKQAVSFDKPTKAVQSDVLTACRTDHATIGKMMRYFFITAISDTGGYNKPDAVHVMCNVIHQRDMADDLATQL